MNESRNQSKKGSASQAELERVKEALAVAQSQIDNNDATLAQAKLAHKSQLERVKQQLADSEEAVQILAKGGAEYRQQRDELLTAAKRFHAIADKLDHDSVSTDLWNEYVIAQDKFKDAIAVAEGRAS